MKKKIFLKIFQFISELSFGIFLLGLIALTSSLGSLIEQDQTLSFYQENYSKPLFGFFNASFLLFFGLNHVYTTSWFTSFLTLFGLSLFTCTLRRQFPLFLSSKEFFFKKKKNSFLSLPFSIQFGNFFYAKESFLTKLQSLHFSLYQKSQVFYGYKGLIGRISPILVHLSLILLLGGVSFGAFSSVKLQEVIPKGEIFHLQNPLRVGYFASIPQLNLRLNDFWVEYQNNQTHQFYSDLSVITNFGQEIRQQSLSVNHPFRFQFFDFYQSDWNFLGIRIKDEQMQKIYEFPLFPAKNNLKSSLTWIKENHQIKTLVFDQFQQSFLLSEKEGQLFQEKNLGENFQLSHQPFSSSFRLIEILSSTGFLIKSDPSIFLVYTSFGLLMLTASLSYLPYTQIWLLQQKEKAYVGSSTNRGKIQVEFEFENLIRFLEFQASQKQNLFQRKKNL